MPTTATSTQRCVAWHIYESITFWNLAFNTPPSQSLQYQMSTQMHTHTQMFLLLASIVHFRNPSSRQICSWRERIGPQWHASNWWHAYAFHCATDCSSHYRKTDSAVWLSWTAGRHLRHYRQAKERPWSTDQEDLAMKWLYLLPQGCFYLLLTAFLFSLIHHNAQHIFKLLQTIQSWLTKFE